MLLWGSSFSSVTTTLLLFSTFPVTTVMGVAIALLWGGSRVQKFTKINSFFYELHEEKG